MFLAHFVAFAQLPLCLHALNCSPKPFPESVLDLLRVNPGDICGKSMPESAFQCSGMSGPLKFRAGWEDF